jgi:integrase
MAAPKPITVAQYNGSKPVKQLDQSNTTFSIDESGKRSWRYRVRTKKVSYDTNVKPSGNLQKDRLKFAEWNALVAEGVHPNKARKPNSCPTFREVAEDWLTNNLSGFNNPKHRQQWGNTLRDYAYPTLGDMPVSEISTRDVYNCLVDIWSTKSETASRVRQRIEKIIGAAIALEHAEFPNPAVYKGNLEHLLGKSKSAEKQPSLDWRNIPALIDHLRTDPSKASLCLQLICLTACRKTEIRLARWDEINEAADQWVIPASRMKMRQEHRIAITEQMKACLDQLRENHLNGAFLFPSPQDNTKAFSDTVIDQKVRQCRQDLELAQHWVIHGLRSSFKTWAGEVHSSPREVTEACLAHATPGVEGRYFRGDFFDKRKQLMNDWNAFCFAGVKS